MKISTILTWSEIEMYFSKWRTIFFWFLLSSSDCFLPSQRWPLSLALLLQMNTSVHHSCPALVPHLLLLLLQGQLALVWSPGGTGQLILPPKMLALQFVVILGQSSCRSILLLFCSVGYLSDAICPNFPVRVSPNKPESWVYKILRPYLCLLSKHWPLETMGIKTCLVCWHKA